MSGAASRIVSVQAKEYRSRGKLKLGGIAGTHRNGPQQFTSVIPIAWSRHPSPETDAYALGADVV